MVTLPDATKKMEPGEINDRMDAALSLQAAQSFPDYCQYVHDYSLLPHQLEWAETFLTPGYQAIESPPGYYKTTLARMLAEFLIGVNPNTSGLYLMNTEPQAALNAIAIQHTIKTNIKYQRTFPHIKEDTTKPWTRNVMFVQRDLNNDQNPTLQAYGYLGPYQGAHPDWIIIDDMTDPKDVESEQVMRLQEGQLRGVIFDRVKKPPKGLGCGIKLIMTPWGENDLWGVLGEMGFSQYSYMAEGRYSWGRLLAKEINDDQGLEDIRTAKKKSPIPGTVMRGNLYLLTYMMQRQAAVGSLIKRDWWRFYHNLPDKFHQVIHSWDLATGRKSTGDYTAYTAWGRSDQGYFLIDLDRWLDIGSPSKVAEKMQVLYHPSESRLIPRYEIIEDVGSSTGVVDYLKEETHLPIMAVKPGTSDKKARLNSILGLIETGRVWLPSNHPRIEEFMDECSVFTGMGDRHDDWVDSMVYGIRYLLQNVSSTGEGGAKILRAGGDSRRRWQTKRSKNPTTFLL